MAGRSIKLICSYFIKPVSPFMWAQSSWPIYLLWAPRLLHILTLLLLALGFNIWILADTSFRPLHSMCQSDVCTADRTRNSWSWHHEEFILRVVVSIPNTELMVQGTSGECMFSPVPWFFDVLGCDFGWCIQVSFLMSSDTFIKSLSLSHMQSIFSTKTLYLILLVACSFSNFWVQYDFIPSTHFCAIVCVIS